LYRVNVQGGRPAFLEQLAPVTFSQSYVAETYGGGRFLAKSKYKDGTPVKMGFDIEGEPVLLKRKNALAQPGVIPAAPMFFQAPISGGEAVGGMKEFQSAMVGVLQTIVQQMQGSEMAMLEKMKIYKDLFGSPAQKEAPLDQMIGMLQKGIEIAAMNTGGSEGGLPWMMILKELKDPLMKIVDTVQVAVTSGRRLPMVNALAPVATTQAVLPAGGGGVEPSPIPEPQKESDMIMLFVRSVLPSLINGAAKNSDPANYVDFLLDQIPTGSYDALRTWLIQPDCLDKLAAIEPGIRFQQEWWVSLRDGLLEALKEELGDAVRSLHPEPNSNPSAPSPPDSPLIS
jgi:hypothetical protein